MTYTDPPSRRSSLTTRTNAVARACAAHARCEIWSRSVPSVFAAGNVICWAPEFSLQGQGFYVEDMVLITAGGHDLLSPPLPYEPRALEALKASARG